MRGTLGTFCSAFCTVKISFHYPGVVTRPHRTKRLNLFCNAMFYRADTRSLTLSQLLLYPVLISTNQHFHSS